MKRVRLFGKMIPVFVLVLLAIGTASAALLAVFGTITTTVNVKQSILLDGGDYLQANGDTIPEAAPGGETFCFTHDLTNQMSITGQVNLATVYSPDGDGITTTYMEDVDYAYSETWTANGDVLVTVEDTGDGFLEWVYTAVTPVTSGRLKMTVEIDNPTGFGVTTFDDGSHDGWYYYDTAGVVRISDYDGTNKIAGYDSVETSVTADSMTVRINKDNLPNTFMWQGFANFHLASNWIELDTTGSPWVPTGSATIRQALSNPVELLSGQVKYFNVCHAFAINIQPDTYTITTTVEPVIV